MLELKNIVVRYGKKLALKDVSLEAGKGVITTLIGANGAGKSTTLRAISGLAPLESGEIWFDGERVDGRKPEDVVRMGVTHVPEGRCLFPWMSVHDNLLTGAYLRRDKEGVKRDLAKVYEYFPVLNEMRKRLARNMSGGQQQMLAFGRGLLANPKFFLLDEPSIGLAPLVVEDIINTIKRIAEEEKAGILLVEQNASLALEVAERAYVLEVGKVVLAGGAKELQGHPEVRSAYMGV
ncbi:MAG: ABC transporter ATP-binding protein [Thermodesulfobacteriota bacterium]